jgi:NADPH:quinone reductase-like Zn-dependent oxidoreductase
MAKAAGYEVAATCSARNFDYCRQIGADHVFDYTRDSVVEDIVKAFQGRKSAGVFDSVTPEDTVVKCAQIADGLGGRKHVATVMAGVAPQVVPDGLPEDVTTSYCWGSSIKHDEVGATVWGNWLTPALENGQLKCKPTAKVIGKGLQVVEQGCNQVLQGVSASKLVADLA